MIFSLRKRALAEMVGTFALVFAGTGAIVIDQVSGGAITHPGVAMTFGLIVLAMIYTVGDVSPIEPGRDHGLCRRRTLCLARGAGLYCGPGGRRIFGQRNHEAPLSK